MKLTDLIATLNTLNVTKATDLTALLQRFLKHQRMQLLQHY